jgi:hypothetical protein
VVLPIPYRVDMVATVREDRLHIIVGCMSLCLQET